MHMHQRLATDRLVDFSTVEPNRNRTETSAAIGAITTCIQMCERGVYACLHVCSFVCLSMHLLQITSHQIRVYETLNKIWSKVHRMQANATQSFILWCVRDGVCCSFSSTFSHFLSVSAVDEDKLHCWYGRSFTYVSFVWLISKWQTQAIFTVDTESMCIRTISWNSFHSTKWWW